MSWSAEQRVMLREMGVPAFWPDEARPVPAPLEAPPTAIEAKTSAAVAPPLAAHATRSPAAPVSAPAPAPKAPATSSGLRPIAEVLPAVTARTTSGAATAAVLGHRPEGIDTMDWPTLREAVSGCQACGLCTSRTQPVFGVGHEQAHWMIVGEAPGEQEDKQGEPFVGRSGQLLDRMLHAVGLSREANDQADAQRQVFIANVLKCRPPANRNPLPQEMAQCEPYLLRQVALVKPRMILAMGRFAVQSLLQSSEPIGKLRGRVHSYAGVPLVVTYHPAYLLRSPTEKALAWDDLCLAREVLARNVPA